MLLFWIWFVPYSASKLSLTAMASQANEILPVVSHTAVLAGVCASDRTDSAILFKIGF